MSKTPTTINKVEYNPSTYYVVSYHWSYYADGITARNVSTVIYTGNEEHSGFVDRKSASEVVKILKANDRKAMKAFKKSGRYAAGSQGGTYKVSRGDKLKKAISDVSEASVYKIGEWQWRNYSEMPYKY